MRTHLIGSGWLLTIALPLVLASGGCKRTEPDAAVHGEPTLTGAKSPAPAQADASSAKNKRVDDAVVTSTIARELDRDPSVRGAQLRVATKDGIVELMGTVDNLLAKERATRHAEAVKGVRAVSNRVVVDPPHIDDDVLARDVKDGLRANAATEDYDTVVSAKDGVVTLKGAAQSYQEWAAAERVASRTRGVAAVVNQIEIEHKAKRADDEIARDVQERLRWDVLVDGNLVLTQVNDGRVWLGGVVGSAAAKRRAGLDAWVAGVHGVDTSAVEIESWAHRDDQREREHPVKSDAEVERALLDAVAIDPRLRAAVVKASAKGGLVTLRGTVRSLEAKTAAAQLAKHTVGVLDVDNQLAVKPDKPLADLEISRRVMSALELDPYSSKHDIVAKTAGGKVTLTGAVDSFFEKVEAEHVAASVRGVAAVENKVDVRKPTVGFVFDPSL